MDPGDAAALIELEESLWRPDTRFDPAHLERVLARDFEEHGASGRRWTRAEIVAAPAEEFVTELPLPGLRVRALGPDAALLTYRSTTTRPVDGTIRTANRSSVRQRIDGAWRLRFHQGTPAPG